MSSAVLRRLRPSWPAAVLALVAYVPLLLTAPGYVGADTKQYLYLDPGRLLSRAPYLWDEHTGMGGVTHQNIGYLLPQGPWYWVFQELGVPDWVAQRLWTGSLLLAAGVGVLLLMRTFGWRDRPAFLAAATYALTPYVLEYVARISAILAPWAGLPWMVALLVRGLRLQQDLADSRGREGPKPAGRLGYALAAWRYPALFALVLVLISGTNASSLIYAGVAPTLWIPFALAQREVRVRAAVAFLGRTLLLAVLVCLWWAGGLTDQAGYGLNVLKYSETVQTVASASQASEVLRGLGNWFFYGRDAAGPWIEVSREYVGSLWLIAVSFAVPVLALLAGVSLRWRHRAYFVTLVVVGTALAVGVYPYTHPSPLGQLFKDFATGSTAGLALRSSPRAVPVVALGLGVLLAGAVEALAGLRWRRPRLRVGVPALAFVAVLALVALDMAPLWQGRFVDPNLRRREALPSYLTQMADHLQAAPAVGGEQTRVLEVPGADFSDYRWGDVLDPPLPGLMDRPYVSRELIPTGEPASAQLVRAIDRRMQEGVSENDALPSLLRLMGIGDVVLRSDLQYERFRTPQPVPTWAQWSQPTAGLGSPTTYGPPVAETPQFPFLDEIGLAETPGEVDPPAMADFPVTDPVPIVRAESASRPLLVAGDSEGLVDAAAAGLLSTTGVVEYAAAQAAGTVAPSDADLLLTDSDRKRAERWNAVRENYGYVETATGTPLATDPNDARLPVFPDQTTADQTVAVLSGIADVEATAYGNPVGYAPSDQPFHAVDGDPTTAWRVGAFADPRGERLEVSLLAPETASTVTLQQPPGPATRTITQARLTYAGGPHGTVEQTVAMDPSSLGSGQVVTVPTTAEGYTHLSFTIVQTSNGTLQAYDGQSGVGLAELAIPGVHADEVLRLPTDLFSKAGGDGLQQPLSVLLTRDRANPSEPYKTDTELSMARELTLPTARTFSLSGTARVSAQALDSTIDGVLGRTGAVTTATASSALPGSLGSRASAAFDGSTQTAWTAAMGGNLGQWLQVHTPRSQTLSGLDLSVVADGRHSVPTQVQLVVDGTAVQTLALPAIADRGGTGSTTTVHLSFPAVTGSTFRLVVTAERREDTVDYFKHTPEELPVSIAEVTAPGLQVTPAAAQLPGQCRSDLLTIDGQPLSVRITGSSSDAIARDGLGVSLCDPQTVTLAPGTHVLRTSRGSATGIDLDRLLLSSAAGGAAAATSDPYPGQVRTAGAPTVTVTKHGPVSYDLSVTGATTGTPFWLVLGQSLSPAWQATVDGRTLGAPQLVDGFANGWLVHPTSTAMTVSLRWTGQTKVWYALGISAVGLLGCLVVVAAPASWRVARAVRRAGCRSADPLPVLVGPWRIDARRGPWGRLAVAVLVAAGVAAFVIAPLAGAVVLGAAALAAVLPSARALLRLGAVGTLAASAAYVLEVQARYHLPDSSGWVTELHRVATLSWLAVPLLLADVLLGWAAREVGDDSAGSG